MGQADAEYLSAKEAEVVHGECRKPCLFHYISPTVYCRGTGHLRPNDKDQGHVVDPLVDSAEEVVSEFCAVRKAQKEAQHGKDSDNDWS